MRKLLIILAAFAVSFPSFAADNTVIVTPGSGVTMKSKDVGSGVQAMQPIISDVSGNPISFAGQNATSPGSSLLIGCQFNTTPTTITSGNTSPCQLNNAGKLLTSDTAVLAAIQSSIASGTNIIGKVGIDQTTPGTTNAVAISSIGSTTIVADPCQAIAKTYTPINIGTATTTRIIAPTSAKKTYICSIDLFAFAADNIAVVEGTGGTCGSSTAGIVGGTTTATGISFPTQGGLAKGTGASAVWATAGTNVDFCLITSTTGPLTGTVAWVQQ